MTEQRFFTSFQLAGNHQGSNSKYETDMGIELREKEPPKPAFWKNGGLGGCPT